MTTPLGKFIEQLRQEKSWSQKDLAKKAGLSQATIQKLETGSTLHPGINIVVDLSKALGISVMTLVLAYQGRLDGNWKELELDALRTELLQAVEYVFQRRLSK